jgi:hypothetical protein
MNLENKYFQMTLHVGIPTKGKYRFRIQYQNEDGYECYILRADYLVPNVKEWGWTTAINAPTDPTAQLKFICV